MGKNAYRRRTETLPGETDLLFQVLHFIVAEPYKIEYWD